MMMDYIVVSPERLMYPAGETDPPEYGCDVAYVANAKNAKEAKWAAAKLWKRHAQGTSWPELQREDGKHPLTGVKAERAGGLGERESWEPFYVDMLLEREGNADTLQD